MHLDVVDLRSFYYRTKLGRAVQRDLRSALAALIGEDAGKTVVGFGFAAPFLRPYLEAGAATLCLMPGQQGVMPWPPGMDNVSVLVEETHWPVDSGSVDTLIVAHGLETCEQPAMLLQEMWRVLAPGGRAFFIVPNRAGSWARSEQTPFGYGRPYSFQQLERQLRDNRFEPQTHGVALFAPPSQKRFWLRVGGLCERIGRGMDSSILSGALLIEATKQVYAGTRDGKRDLVLSPLDVLEGLTKPRPKPALGRVGPPASAPRPAARATLRRGSATG
ncbi:class I SAM-dependent methyltransferase [Oceanomicrobium pacificus]|uniref:Methyltransferase domain-containing protein n=1 Tax=Oceanomicrobium pacificus TaxID=2692916 RepID=A0A6B0TNT4_9RHOB|nr:class I SAM-dependent methyltransferase [Oceanomicrobium pacificus]MXU64249.1 methyltransferase domain-containing protein [Oceanomicrobium pacificus]